MSVLSKQQTPSPPIVSKVLLQTSDEGGSEAHWLMMSEDFPDFVWRKMPIGLSEPLPEDIAAALIVVVRYLKAQRTASTGS